MQPLSSQPLLPAVGPSSASAPVTAPQTAELEVKPLSEAVAPAAQLELTPLPGSATAPQVSLVAADAPAPVTKPRPPARPARVSAYGPGLYGNRTANGTRLTPDTVGVAHKTLPLGTRLEVIVNGKTVPARVIDRGPYERGRDFDLTTGLIKKLGFPNCNIFGVRQVLIRIFK